MSRIKHPIRGQTFSVYRYDDGKTVEPDRQFLAFFSDYQKYPVYFHGANYMECLGRAVAFRDSEAEKHERHYRTRIEALRKARKAKRKTDNE